MSRVLLIWTMLFCLGGGLAAQALRRVQELPDAGKAGDWVLLEPAQSLRRWDGGQWVVRNTGVLQVEECGGHLIVQLQGDAEGRRSLHPLDGGAVIWTYDYACGDSTLFAFGPGWYYVSEVVTNGKLQFMHCYDRTFNAQQVRGRAAWCVPRPVGTRDLTFRCEDARLWGMLDETGRWLIPPRYDKPFEFVGGVAEVMIYGEPHRIDELGRLVD